MKYAVVTRPTTSITPVVLASFRWLWLAQVYSFVRCEPEIVSVDTSPQAVINICEQRDDAIRAAADRDHLVRALWGMVARDDEGRWATVHAVDTVLDDETAEILSSVLA